MGDLTHQSTDLRRGILEEHSFSTNLTLILLVSEKKKK